MSTRSCRPKIPRISRSSPSARDDAPDRGRPAGNGALPSSPTTSRPDAGELLDGCRRLLYTTYVKEQRWLPGADNPIGIRAETDEKGRPMLCDDVDAHAAWAAVTDERCEAVIACGRVQVGSPRWALEMSLYPSCPNELAAQLRSSEAMEINRYAVTGRYRGTHIALTLTHLLLEYGRSRGATRMIFSTSSLAVLRIVESIPGMPALSSYAFRYEHTDPMHVDAYVMDASRERSRERLASVGVSITSLPLADDGESARTNGHHHAKL